MPTIPGTLNYPGALDTAVSLFEVADQSATTLSAGISASDTTISVVSMSSFPSTGSTVIDSEVVYYTGKTSTTLTGVLRGQSGTTAAVHSLGAAVEGQIIAAHHSILSAAIVATQTKLGYSDSVPTTPGDILTVTAAGQSAWVTPTPLAWGLITGTLSNQADLNTALNLKLAKASNLSDLASASTARTNLGLGTLATQSGTFSGTHSGTSSGANTGDQTPASLGLVIGTNVEAWDADLDAIAALSGTSGILKKTAANMWTLDTTSYATSADLSGYVPTTRTVNGHALSSNVSVTTSDLGATTVGGNLFTATNPSAISFPKIAADNTVSFRTPAQVLSDIGAQASLGFTAENSANKDAASGYAGLTSGSLLKTAEFPAFTGDVTTTAGGVVTVLGNIPTGTPMAGSLLATNIAAPSSPASGKTSIFVDSTDLRLHDKNASGAIGTTVVANTGDSNQFLTAISAAGVVSRAQPTFANLASTPTTLAGYGITDALAGTLTSGTVPVASGATTVWDSRITDDGSGIHLTTPNTITYLGDWSGHGLGTVAQINDIDKIIKLQSTGTVSLGDPDGSADGVGLFVDNAQARSALGSGIAGGFASTKGFIYDTGVVYIGDPNNVSDGGYFKWQSGDLTAMSGSSSSIKLQSTRTVSLGDVDGSSGGTHIIIDDSQRTTTIYRDLVVDGYFIPSSPGNRSVGALPLPFSAIYIGDQATNNIKLLGSATDKREIVLPDASGTVLLTDGNASGLTNLNANALASGAVDSARMPAFTGDITTSAGTVATTLATVNSNVGSFGSATQVATFTVNAKGLTTAAANVTITPAFSSLTGSIAIGQIADGLITNAKLSTIATAGKVSDSALSSNIPLLNAANVFTVNGALSTPGLNLNGTWITGGSATTTKPYFLIETTSATSTNWSTSGTGIGVNAASGFAGNLFDAQVNGVSELLMTSGGSTNQRGSTRTGGFNVYVDGATAMAAGVNGRALSAADNMGGGLGGLQMAANYGLYFNSVNASTGADASNGGNVDTTISRSAAGVIRFGTTAANASGSWLATNGTLSGILTLGSTAILRGPATGTLALGAADAASPVAQTLSFQGGSGTNIAGVNATIVAPLGTGTGTNGDIVFQTGVKTTTGSGAPTKTTALTIKGETQAAQHAGDVVVTVAGKGLQLQSGTGARAGTAVLVGGTVTVTNSTVGSTSHIQLTRKTAAGTLGAGLVYSVSNGVSFTITAVDATGVLSALDTSTIEYLIYEVN